MTAAVAPRSRRAKAMSMTKLRLIVAACVPLASAVAILAACRAEEGTAAAPADGDATADVRKRRSPDGGAIEGEGEADGDAEEAGATADAGKDARPARDANGAGEAGDDCFLNYDCALALRCTACVDGYCTCEKGARGTGELVVDSCDGGDDCRSGLCVENLCSDDCTSADDCKAPLSRCLDIRIAQICSPPAP